MDTLTNMKAFVAVARCGSFAGAARQLSVAASVITKRIEQLEWRAGASLFERSTRRVALTEAGHRMLPEASRIVHDVDDVFARMRAAPQQLAGRLRIKVPTTLTALHLADMLARFQAQHPSLTMEIVALDRPVDPVQEGFDVSLGMFPASFAGAAEIDLCVVPRMVVAAPAYLARHGPVRHPTQLLQHEIVNFQPMGETWTFTGDNGPIAVTLSPRLNSNDGQVLLGAALQGNGITLLTSYVVLPAVRAGRLVPLLTDYEVPTMWVRALVPEASRFTARVTALVDFLRAELSPPPWERPGEAPAVRPE